MHIHFIGIGGIGMSALAQYYLSHGHKISGSDLADSEIIQLLKNKKVNVSVGKNKSTNLSSKTDLVIYSPAVTSKNPELIKAKKLKIKTKPYPEALGELTKKYFTIAVCGTHGKSTTSSMISLILLRAKMDPTVIVGTKLKELNNSNFRHGKSKYLVIEADEYKKSFLNYNPQIVILTNIEKDHLDYYKNLKNILKAFRQFLNNINDNGYLILNDDDKNIKKIISKNNNFQIKKYSINDSIATKIKKILKIPGEHNVYNALAALFCARILKIKDQQTLKILSQFKGCWRRFQEHNLNKLKIIVDYAHHPTEVEKTLKAVREKYPNKKIRCVFQPHQYQRTLFFFKDFVRVIKKAPVDEFIICEIYDVAGRETKKTKKTISSQKIKQAVNSDSIKYMKNLKQAEKYIRQTIKKNEVLIIMGAGDIYNLFLELKSKNI